MLLNSFIFLFPRPSPIACLVMPLEFFPFASPYAVSPCPSRASPSLACASAQPYPPHASPFWTSFATSSLLHLLPPSLFASAASRCSAVLSRAPLFYRVFRCFIRRSASLSATPLFLSGVPLKRNSLSVSELLKFKFRNL